MPVTERRSPFTNPSQRSRRTLSPLHVSRPPRPVTCACMNSNRGRNATSENCTTPRVAGSPPAGGGSGVPRSTSSVALPARPSAATSARLRGGAQAAASARSKSMDSVPVSHGSFQNVPSPCITPFMVNLPPRLPPRSRSISTRLSRTRAVPFRPLTGCGSSGWLSSTPASSTSAWISGSDVRSGSRSDTNCSSVPVVVTRPDERRGVAGRLVPRGVAKRKADSMSSGDAVACHTSDRRPSRPAMKSPWMAPSRSSRVRPYSPLKP